MNTHDLGRFYATRVHYATTENPPFMEVGQTCMIEEPYRVGKCLVLRVPFSRHAVVIGWWGPPGEEVATLSKAIGYRKLEGDQEQDALIVGQRLAEAGLERGLSESA